jgi:hypothetical protein
MQDGRMTPRIALGHAAAGVLALLLAACSDSSSVPTAPAASGPQVAPGCRPLDFGDPEAEARRALAARDYRLFTVDGFTIPSAPGLSCDDPHRLRQPGISRGGTTVSDVADVCGRHSFSIVPPDRQAAFNRAMARDPEVVRASGCRRIEDCIFDTSWAANAAISGAVPDAPLPPLRAGCEREKGQLYAHVIHRDLAGAQRLLARAPADWSRPDTEARNFTPLERALMLAASNGDERMLALLLPRVARGRIRAGAEIRGIERALLLTFTSPAHAPDADRRRVARQLFTAGARTEFAEGTIATSLLSALIASMPESDPNRLDWVRMFLAHGADPNGPRCGESVRHWPATPLARATRDPAITALLVQAGGRWEGHGCGQTSR